MIRLVLSQGMRLAVIGIVTGLAATYALTRTLKGLLFGIEQNDPVISAIVAAILFTIAGAAALIPALRATQVDPISALRQD